MTTLMASVNAALPKISYIKSIDIYLGFCFFMVFGALIGISSFIQSRIMFVYPRVCLKLKILVTDGVLLLEIKPAGPVIILSYYPGRDTPFP